MADGPPNTDNSSFFKQSRPNENNCKYKWYAFLWILFILDYIFLPLLFWFATARANICPFISELKVVLYATRCRFTNKVFRNNRFTSQFKPVSLLISLCTKDMQTCDLWLQYKCLPETKIVFLSFVVWRND